MKTVKNIIAFPLILVSMVISGALNAIAVGFRSVSDFFFTVSDRTNLFRS